MTPLHVVLIVLFLAASFIQAQPADVPPSAGQLREWIDDGCVKSGKQFGIDYRDAVERAIRQEPAGLTALFRFTDMGGADGAAGEAHSAILFGLLQRWGDKRFAHVLRAQKLRVRKAVINDIAMPSGGELKFPLTSALGKNH